MNQPHFKIIIWCEARNNIWTGLCKKYFHGATRQIIFGWRHLFLDFAKQNREKDVSIQRIFCRRRRQNTFHTTSLRIASSKTATTAETASATYQTLVWRTAPNKRISSSLNFSSSHGLLKISGVEATSPWIF